MNPLVFLEVDSTSPTPVVFELMFRGQALVTLTSHSVVPLTLHIYTSI